MLEGSRAGDKSVCPVAATGPLEVPTPVASVAVYILFSRHRGTRRGVGDAEAFEAELTAGGVGIEIEAAVEVEGPADDEADEDDHEE
jgi:hypothetical protein